MRLWARHNRMDNTASNESPARNQTAAKRLWLACGWLLAVLFFASLWYAYDSGHHVSDPFVDYIGWSCYIWGVLTPIALWLARRLPIDSKTWMRAIPLHVVASVLLAVVQLTLEASAEWLRSRGGWPFA